MTEEPGPTGSALFEPEWSYIHRPVERPQETPIFEQLVMEMTAPPVEQPEDPVIGTP